MPLRWLAEDETHPIRPDLPLFRHLTFTEVHAFELGAYVGLLAFFALGAGMEGELVILLFAITRFTIGDGKATAGATKAEHTIGFHDVRMEPPYFGAGALIGFATVVVATRVWAVLGLGPIA